MPNQNRNSKTKWEKKSGSVSIREIQLNDQREDLKEEEEERLLEQDKLEDEFQEVGKDPREYRDQELKSYGYGDDGLNYSDAEDDTPDIITLKQPESEVKSQEKEDEI